MVESEKSRLSGKKWDVFDFPEDGFPRSEEFELHTRLSAKALVFLQSHYEKDVQAAFDLFAPADLPEPENMHGDTHNTFMLIFFDWLIYDLAIDDGSDDSLLDLFLRRKKLDLDRRQREIIQMMRQARMDLYEVREVFPGRGMVFRRLSDGNDLPVVDMTASRQLTRWSLVASRLLTLDGVFRLSPGSFVFEPERLERLEQIVTQCRRTSKRSGVKDFDYLRGLPPVLCREWLEPVIHPRLPKLRNRDGSPLLFCTARFRVDDRAAVHRALRQQKKIILVEEDADHLAWICDEGEKIGGAIIRGRFTWEMDELVFEVNSLRRYNRGMKVLKNTCGERIRLVDESRRSVDDMLAEKTTDQDQELPALPEGVDPEMVTSYKRRYYSEWLNEPIPALNGKTPFEAVRSKSGRRMVVRLLKGLEKTELEPLQPGSEPMDTGFLWEQLGLDPEDY